MLGFSKQASLSPRTEIVTRLGALHRWWSWNRWFLFRVSWPFDLSGISVRADSFGRVFMFISTIREGMRRIEVLEVCAVVGRG